MSDLLTGRRSLITCSSSFMDSPVPVYKAAAMEQGGGGTALAAPLPGQPCGGMPSGSGGDQPPDDRRWKGKMDTRVFVEESETEEEAHELYFGHKRFSGDPLGVSFAKALIPSPSAGYEMSAVLLR